MRLILSVFLVLLSVTAFAVDEYGRLSAKLNTIETRIRDQRKSIMELAIEKNNASEKQQKLKLIEQMKTVNQALNADIDEYNEIKSKIEHRYPKRKGDIERRYRPQKRQSVEEIESNVGLVKNIQQVEALLEKQYGKFKKTKEVEAFEKHIEKTETQKKEESKKKLRLIN